MTPVDVDVLEGGSERAPSVLLALLARLPASVVALALAAVLACSLVGLQRVSAEQRERDDVSGVRVRLVVEQTTRAGDGSAYGFARLEVRDPGGRPVELQDLDLDVPGVRLGRRGPALADLAAAPELVLPLRLAVPDCAELVLPGRLGARLARPDGPSQLVAGSLDDVALRRACGRPPSG